MEDILNGYNGTVLAYGQTGAGKSYTMMGSDIEDNESRGIIPRIVEQMFSCIKTSPSNIEYTVRISYMEIYMERIRDLMMTANDNLSIHEDKTRGVYVKNLLEIYVSTEAEVYEVMRRGGAARATAATNMNQESSRSHSIFVVTITQKNIETGSAKSGQLNLVDLAGSEKVGKTGASGQTLEEAKKINKSLSALGMVINALTDGKSTHVPYRDSKLTRILQESLGGNSRTTLIINCSPSSYNDAETLSTLRFGVRAKTIKNKAKINAELSPVELKQLLKKAQHKVVTYESYMLDLEGEVLSWRSGETVPKEKWAPPLADDSVTAARADYRAQGTATPSRLQIDFGLTETPSRSESGIGDRSSTPSIILDKDEREEFLRRENELQDQIAERESQILLAEKRLKEAKEELQVVKENNGRTSKENEDLSGQINELQMHIERIAYESREASVDMDSMKEANSELAIELSEVKQQLLNMKMSVKETSAVLDEKEQKRTDRMAQMMAEFDMVDSVPSDNEVNIMACINQVDILHQMSVAGEKIEPDDLHELKKRLLETKAVVRQAEVTVHSTKDNAGDQNGNYNQEELLERKIEDIDAEEIKSRFEGIYKKSPGTQLEMLKNTREDVGGRDSEIQRLRAGIEDQQYRSQASTVVGSFASSFSHRAVQQQIADFDAMKKSLMRDLQNRCERVVELEICLDETKEQYNNILKASKNRAQQKKMAFLERNLEQLTLVQRQLMEQNGGLKKEVAIAERKLEARNDRIKSLEGLLHDSQEKLTLANHRYVSI